MKHIILFLISLLVAPTSFGQTDEPFHKLGGVYHPYIQGKGNLTPAPKGYKAFYISHVGRHGSRYPVDEHYVMVGLEPLRKCDAEGILTDEGKKLLGGFEKLHSISQGVYGLINETGAQEHKGIAQRMYENFPEVFQQDGRDSIFVQSTHRQRCLMSAWNFCTTLQAKVPQLKMDLVAGEKYYDILANAETPEISARNKRYGKYSDRYTQKHCDIEKLASRLFSNPKRGRAIFKNDRLLLETIYANGTVAKYLGINEIYSSVLPEDYETAARSYAGKMNCQHCGSKENGAFRVEFARPLLQDFIDRTDTALKGNGLAADLRFSHDTGMMPFFALIGLKGYHHHYTFDEASQNWDSTILMCMATNLQAIFYRNDEGEILVKLLHNEEETSLPALGNGPFYTWKELRNYLSNL